MSTPKPESPKFSEADLGERLKENHPPQRDRRFLSRSLNPVDNTQLPSEAAPSRYKNALTCLRLSFAQRDRRLTRLCSNEFISQLIVNTEGARRLSAMAYRWLGRL